MVWIVLYEVDIIDVFCNGINVLEVEVVNIWVNVFCGVDQDKVFFEGIWMNVKFCLFGDDLLFVGWMGFCEFFKIKE